jgi:uncharacterized protein (DUF58 family)
MAARSSPAPAPPSDAAGGKTSFDEAFLRKLERLAVVAKRVTSGAVRGNRKTRRSGAGLEFADHRDYEPGDDLRRLDWNLYGRLERPLLRLFDEDEDLPLYLLLDTSASMGIGTPSKLDLAVKTAAALAYVALAGLDRVAVYTASDGLGDGFGPQRGKAQIHPVLGVLGSMRPAGRTDLGAAVRRLVARHRRRGVVVLVSDFFDPAGFEEALDRLRYSRFEPVVVQITAPEELDPPLQSDLVLVDVETGSERQVTVTPTVREAYRRTLLARLESLDRFCRRRAIPCFQVQSHHPFEDLVLRLFRAGGFLD